MRGFAAEVAGKQELRLQDGGARSRVDRQAEDIRPVVVPDRIEEASCGWHQVQIEVGCDDALLPFHRTRKDCPRSGPR
jgi:hypothetical protein